MNNDAKHNYATVAALRERRNVTSPVSEFLGANYEQALTFSAVVDRRYR